MRILILWLLVSGVSLVACPPFPEGPVSFTGTFANFEGNPACGRRLDPGPYRIEINRAFFPDPHVVVSFRSLSGRGFLHGQSWKGLVGLSCDFGVTREAHRQGPSFEGHFEGQLTAGALAGSLKLSRVYDSVVLCTVTADFSGQRNPSPFLAR